MHEWQSLSHVRWECKYHVVIITNCRRKVFGVFQTPAPNGGYLT
jgi:putative transposase